MKIIYSQDAIQAATRELARALNSDYKGQEIHLVGVLKGAFIFMADLVRHLDGPCTVDFVRLSSYAGGTRTTGEVREVMGLTEDLAGRHVVVVEEIVDSGTTLAVLLKHLEAQRPASLKVCALVDKSGRRETEVPVHYRGFHLDDGFVVGYGLDLDERYRNLPFIGVLEPHALPLLTKESPMATWTCPNCGNEREARCKPKKCATCDQQVEFQKKDAPKK